ELLDIGVGIANAAVDLLDVGLPPALLRLPTHLAGGSERRRPDRLAVLLSEPVQEHPAQDRQRNRRQAPVEALRRTSAAFAPDDLDATPRSGDALDRRVVDHGVADMAEHGLP